MNAQQIKMAEGVIRINTREIEQLNKELENPNIRKPQKRIDTIEALQVQIDQAKKILAAA